MLDTYMSSCQSCYLLDGTSNTLHNSLLITLFVCRENNVAFLIKLKALYSLRPTASVTPII